MGDQREQELTAVPIYCVSHVIPMANWSLFTAMFAVLKNDVSS